MLDSPEFIKAFEQTINDILVWVGFGTLAGLLAKAIMPGRDPGGTVIGDRVRSVLLDFDLSQMDVRCETFLFMASRAQLVGEVVGYASGMDRGHTGAGLARIIRNALKDAEITPADVDHVNAHGIGVPKFDAFEARGIAEVFGRDVPVFAPLSRFGNMGGASGIVELLCSVLALQHGELPGTLNHEHAFPGCPIAVHTGAPRKVTKPYAVKTSYTDLGQCAVAVVKKWEE